MSVPAGPFLEAGVEVPAPKRIPVPRSEHQALIDLQALAQEQLAVSRQSLAALEKIWAVAAALAGEAS